MHLANLAERFTVNMAGTQMHGAPESPVDTCVLRHNFAGLSRLYWHARLAGARSGPGGFTGTLYDGGYLLADLRDKAHTLAANQAGSRPPHVSALPCLRGSKYNVLESLENAL